MFPLQNNQPVSINPPADADECRQGKPRSPSISSSHSLLLLDAAKPERFFLVSLQALTPHLGSKTVLGGLNEIGALLNDHIPHVFRWGLLPRSNLHWLISNHRSHSHSSWIQEGKHQDFGFQTLLIQATPRCGADTCGPLSAIQSTTPHMAKTRLLLSNGRACRGYKQGCCW